MPKARAVILCDARSYAQYPAAIDLERCAASCHRELESGAFRLSFEPDADDPVRAP